MYVTDYRKQHFPKVLKPQFMSGFVLDLYSNFWKVSPFYMVDPTQVFFQTFWMRSFGSPTPKRTVVYSNSPKIKMLDAGPMRKGELRSNIRTTKQYLGKDGRKRFAGNENLKGTQSLGSNVFCLLFVFELMNSKQQHSYCRWLKSCTSLSVYIVFPIIV